MSHQIQNRQPVLAISHESPMLWDTPSPAHHFLKTLTTYLPQRPRAILVVSAHWHTATATVSSAAQPQMIYDFGRFADRYRQVQYTPPGSPALAQKVQSSLQAHNIPCELDAERGLDHAVWLVAGLAFPEAEIPVVSIAVQPRQQPQHHLALGKALASLREDNVLIITSGTATHNLRAFFSAQQPDVEPGTEAGRLPIDAPADPDVVAFQRWLHTTITTANLDDLVNFRTTAPLAAHLHPSPDHFLPFVVAAGAATGAATGQPGEGIHESTNYGHFAMDAYLWR